MGASLQIEKHWNVFFGQAVAQLLENGCFPYSALSVDDKNVVSVTTTQAVLDPIEDILTTKEHPGFNNRCSGDVGIDQFTHGPPLLPCKSSRI